MCTSFQRDLNLPQSLQCSTSSQLRHINHYPKSTVEQVLPGTARPHRTANETYLSLYFRNALAIRLIAPGALKRIANAIHQSHRCDAHSHRTAHRLLVISHITMRPIVRPVSHNCTSGTPHSVCGTFARNSSHKLMQRSLLDPRMVIGHTSCASESKSNPRKVRRLARGTHSLGSPRFPAW